MGRRGWARVRRCRNGRSAKRLCHGLVLVSKVTQQGKLSYCCGAVNANVVALWAGDKNGPATNWRRLASTYGHHLLLRALAAAGNPLWLSSSVARRWLHSAPLAFAAPVFVARCAAEGPLQPQPPRFPSGSTAPAMEGVSLRRGLPMRWGPGADPAREFKRLRSTPCMRAVSSVSHLTIGRDRATAAIDASPVVEHFSRPRAALRAEPLHHSFWTGARSHCAGQHHRCAMVRSASTVDNEETNNLA
jgi:hypothetical protein